MPILQDNTAPAPIGHIDHVILVTSDMDRIIGFYQRVLAAKLVGKPYVFNGAVAVRRIAVGAAVLSIHQAHNGLDLVAKTPAVGGLDICFRWLEPIDTAIQHLKTENVQIIEGPVRREAADGTIGQSVYFRDPDGNLLEFLSTSD
jgi:catechol 2,3-dioxygenase-like lactoylglutathione lyase family enzyme